MIILNYLGDKLVSNSDAPQRDFTFFVLKDDAINAFAMLGGLIGVHTGLFISADNESEIASVLGHEIAHVTQKHLQRVIAKQDRDKYKSIFLLALGLVSCKIKSSSSCRCDDGIAGNERAKFFRLYEGA